MELMSYQKKVLNNLSSYLQCLNDEKDIYKAWIKYWNNQDIAVGFGGVPNYNDDQVDKIYNFIKGLKNVQKVKVLTYHNFAGSKYESIGLKNTMPKVIPCEERINKIQTRFAFLLK